MKDQLEKLDYQILEYVSDQAGYFKSVSAKKINKDQYIVVEREENPSFLDTYLCTLKMVGPSKINLNFKLSLPNPSILSPSVEQNENQIYFIEAEDEQIVKDLLEDDRIHYIFSNLMDLAIKQEMRISSKKGKSLVLIETNCNFYFTLAALPWMETIFESIEKSPDLNSFIKSSVKLACSSCNSVISFKNNKCNNCGKKTPICVICLKSPNLDNKVGKTVCCQSYIHVNELKIWTKVRNICPYCRIHSPEIKLISN